MKRIFFFFMNGLLIVSAFSCKKTASPAPVTNGLTTGLILNYTFDGNAQDLTTNKYDGTIVGTPVFGTDRKGKSTSKSLTIDGSKGFVERNSIAQNLEKVTMSVWFKPSSSQQNSPLFYEGESSSNGWGTVIYSGEVDVKGDKCKVLLGKISKDIVNSNISLQSNIWSHVVVTKEGTLFKLYINGKFISSGDGTPNAFTTGKFSIGGINNTGRTFALIGDIDDVKVFNRILSDSDISTLYSE